MFKISIKDVKKYCYTLCICKLLTTLFSLKKVIFIIDFTNKLEAANTPHSLLPSLSITPF
jgi:hypothetical protein